MKHLSKLLLGVLGVLAVNYSFAADYPAQEGYVYDGAEMLSAAEEQQLEDRLRKFEERTTIGIAVATVPTLGGVDSNTYALELGNRWEIGDPATDNGVIIVLARQERELALWFADGYASNWAQRTSNFIRDGVMVPQLKRGDYAAAIKNGVSALRSDLEAGSYVERWSGVGTSSSMSTSADADTNREVSSSGRSAAMSEAAQQVKRENHFLESFYLDGRLTPNGVAWVVRLGVPLLIVLGIALWRRRKERRELLAEIDLERESLTHKLEQLPAVERKLRAGYPESMWGPALNAINAGAIERLIYTDATKLNNKDVTRLRDELRAANGGIERALDLLRRADNARVNAPRLLRELPSRIDAVRVALQNPDVLPETAAQLAPLEVRASELTAQLPVDASAQFDWAGFGDAVDKLSADADALRQQAATDVTQVRQARADVPRLMEEAQQKLSSLRALNKGRYGDVDAALAEADSLVGGYYGYGRYDSLNARDIVHLLHAVNTALQHAQRAETTYTQHTRPSSSGSSFGRGGGGGSSSWGGGSSGGGSSFGGGGGRGGGGGSSKW